MASARLVVLRCTEARDRTVFPSRHFINATGWLESMRACWKSRRYVQPAVGRVKFLSIFSSNLDEFFMFALGGLRRRPLAMAPQATRPTGSAITNSTLCQADTGAVAADIAAGTSRVRS